MSTLVNRYRKQFSGKIDTEKYSKGTIKQKDSRIWNLDPDEEGNSSAQIRFLPRPFDDIVEGAEYDKFVNFVCKIDHYYKNGSKVYFQLSRRTWGESDPVNDFNNQVYDRDKDLYKTIVSCNSGTKRRVSYYSNIYVENDIRHPENNGKVFLFRFGPQIKQKIEDCINPKDKLEDPIDPFDVFNGVGFRYVSFKKGPFVNYEKSRFDTSPSALTDDEDLMEDILKQCYSLKEFIDITKMKSYEVLENKFIEVMGKEDYYHYRGINVPVISTQSVSSNNNFVMEPEKESDNSKIEEQDLDDAELDNILG